MQLVSTFSESPRSHASITQQRESSARTVHNGAPASGNGNSSATYGNLKSAAVAPEMLLLRSEIDDLIDEVRAQLASVDPQKLTPSLLVHKLNQTIGQRFSAGPIELLTELEGNLEGTTFSDFADRDVLQGICMLTYYSLQIHADSLRVPVQVLLGQVYGRSIVRDLRAGLAGASMQDLLASSKWKSVWQVTTYGALLKTIDLFHK